jgi:hypothetical protein
MEVGMVVTRRVTHPHRLDSIAGIERRRQWTACRSAQQPIGEHEREIQLTDAGRSGDQPSMAEARLRERRLEQLQGLTQPRAKALAERLETMISHYLLRAGR